MVILCPITSNEKEFPTHYLLKHTKKVKRSVLYKHIKSIDYEIRYFKYVEKMDIQDFENLLDLLNACL